MSVPVPAADGSTPESGGAPIPQPGIARPGVPAGDEVATIPISSSVRQSTLPPVPDSDLLAAFVDRKDQTAFTAIVERYSALVYRVALRSLNDRHLADDLFQATFLVLAQSARRIKDGDLLAAWLHGTARNLARRALTHKQSQRNQLAISTSLTRSQKGGEMSTPAELDPLDQLVRRHEQQLLDEELQNLPESSRAPLVLYYLEEKSQAEIAQLMGLTVDAVEGRLRRAKHDLRLRLIRRGVTLSGVVAAATLLTPSLAAAAPTPALISTTISVALGTAAGTSLAAASTTAATLATKEVAAMSLASKAAAFVFGTAGVLTVSAGLIFGAVVTSMGREGAERQAAARAQAERSLENDEISTELTLIDEVPAELTQTASPPVDQPSTGDRLRPVVHQVGDFSPEERTQIQEFAQSLGAEAVWHEGAQSYVIRANEKGHRAIADFAKGIRKEHVEEISKQPGINGDVNSEVELQRPETVTMGHGYGQLSAEQRRLAFEYAQAHAKQVVHTDDGDQMEVTASDEIHSKIGDFSYQLQVEPRQAIAGLQSDLEETLKTHSENHPAVERLKHLISEVQRIADNRQRGKTVPSDDDTLPTMQMSGLNWAEKMFSSLKHDFGDVAPESVTRHVIEITNRYKETVTLTAPVSHCGRCVTLELDRTVLQSKEVAHLTITLDTERFRGKRDFTISMDASFEPKNSKQVQIPVTANIVAPESVEVDARISHVDSKNRAVWLDIGKQHNLQPQITFSVYDKSQSGLAPSPERVKARIEVVEVRDTSSIARIVEEIHSIAIADLVDSPAWDAREPEHFALSGISDLNGDGVADGRDRMNLKNHLSHHGAVIDVEITHEGVREPADGQLTDQTKWLVVGEVPANAVSQEHLKLVDEARKQGVRIVALKDFLSSMGWMPASRVYLPTPDSDGVILIDKPESSVTIMQNQPQLMRFPDSIESTGGFSSKIVSVAPAKPNEILLTGLTTGSTTLEVKDRNKKLYKVSLTIREVEEIDVTRRLEGESHIHDLIVRVRMVERQKHWFHGPVKIQSMTSEHPEIADAGGNWVWALHPGHTTVKAVDADQRSYTLHIEVIPTPDSEIAKFRSLSPEEKRIYDELSQHTALKFPNNTLSEAADYIGARHMIQVRLDKEVLANAGYLADTRISLVDNTRLDYALNRLMQQIQEPKLDYCVDNGVLLITTVEKMNSLSRLRLYDLSCLTAGQQQSVRSYAQSLVPQVVNVATSLALETNLTTHKKLETFLTGVREISKKSQGQMGSPAPIPAVQTDRPKPVADESSVSRTETISLEETDLTIEPNEIVLLKFPGPVTRAEVQYDRAVDVAPVTGQTTQLRVRGTLAGKSELTATLENDMIYRVRFQVGTTPESRFRDLPPTEKKIRRVLEQPVSLEFPDNSLKEVCEFIALMNDIHVQLHGNELKAAGIDADVNVNIVVSGISLRSALKLLLEGLKLDYCIDDDSLIITTPAELKDRKRLDYYNLTSLSAEWQAAAELMIRPLATKVTSLEGGLLVDASLEAHRQLEEFLEQAYQVEMKKPPRPVELASAIPAARAVAPPVSAAVSKQVQDHSPELEEILAQWKTKSAEVRDFTGSFKRLEFDKVFGTETRTMGQLMFERPDSGRIDFGPADAEWQQKPGRMTKDEKPYTIVSGEASTWLSTGTSAYVLSMKDKAYDIFDIPPAFQGKYLDTLPPQSQFGMQPPPMDGSYRFELGRLHNPDGSKLDADGNPMQKAIHVIAVCQIPQANLEYLLDPDTYLPLNVRTLDTSGNKETVYSFDHSSMKVNAGFGPLKASPFQQPDLTGWKLMHHIKDEPAPAQELPVSAKPQNERIALSICMFETTAATVEGLTVESSGKRVPKEGFRKLLDEAVKSKQARILTDPSIVLPFGKSSEFLSGGEIPVPVDGDQTKTSNSLQYGTKFTLNPYRRSAEGLFVAISGELSNLHHGENDDNKGADLPTVEGQIIRALVTIPGSTHEAIVGPIWKAERSNSGGETEKVAIYLQIHEEAITWYDSPVEVLTEPAAPTLIPPDPKTTDDAQPETIARVIDLAEMPQTTPSEVAEALKLLVEPESWKGTCDIKPLGKSIVVRNRREVVEECVKAIEEMIASEKKRVAEEREKAAKGPSL